LSPEKRALVAFVEYFVAFSASKIQDGSQLTGSNNISETMKHIIRIPTVNLRHSTTANSQEVYQGDSNNERQSEMAAKTGNACISELWEVQLKFK